jgi:hypothetical protein
MKDPVFESQRVATYFSLLRIVNIVDGACPCVPEFFRGDTAAGA